MAITSSVPDSHGAAKWFPSWFPWLLFCLTSAYRVYYVLQPKNWWMMHPDEVYQALEVAHSEMYGYGFRAYEYNPPAELHPDTPHIRKLEREHGMAALRSYLLPHAYVMVTWLLELVGLQFNPYLTWKVAHTVAASTLSLAVYRYVRIVFRSHDTACLAAILCVASAQLHVLGTHTLVNSALSAPVFWALSHLHTLINPQSDREGNGNQSSAKSQANGSNPSAGQSKAFTNGQTSLPVSPRQQTNTNKSKGKQKHQKNAQKQRSATPGSAITHRAVDKNGDTRHDSGNQNDRAEKWDVNKNSFLKENKSGVANTFPKTSSTLSKSGAETKAACHSMPFKQKCGSFLQNVLAGFVVGVCVYIRVDIAALVVFTLLPFWSPLRTCYIDVIVCAFGSVFGLVVGIMDDFWCYGWGIMTPYNWFRFNVERDYSALLFGKNDFHLYIFEIFLDNVGIMGLSAVCCVCGVVCVFYSQKLPAGSSKDERSGVGLHPSWRSSTVRTFISWMLLLALYSSKGHKEMRFAHNVIVLILITWANLLQVGVLRLSPSLKMQKCALAVGVALFAFSQWYDVSHLTDSAKQGGNRLAFKFAGDTQDVNQCLYYISSRKDVTGVVLDRNLYATGGYTLLHKDVPVFTIFGNNFLEFRKEDRLVERAKNFIGPQKNITVAYVGKFSNYITAKHSQYVFKFVLQDPRYNYFVALNFRDFSHFGLGEPIHSCRSFKVYRRPTKPSKEQKMLMQYTLNLPPPSNGTILLHEADMLLYYGAWTQARDRFHMALKANPNLVGAYLPLAYAYASMGDMMGSSEVMDECYAKFGAEKCETKRPPLIDLNQFEFGASV